MEISTRLLPTNMWRAEVVDYEGEGPSGEGKDKIAALCELARELWENHDVALFDCLAAIMRHDADSIGPGHIAAHGLRQAASTLEGIV
jgi:hypothetical protein